MEREGDSVLAAFLFPLSLGVLLSLSPARVEYAQPRQREVYQGAVWGRPVGCLVFCIC